MAASRWLWGPNETQRPPRCRYDNSTNLIAGLLLASLLADSDQAHSHVPAFRTHQRAATLNRRIKIGHQKGNAWKRTRKQTDGPVSCAGTLILSEYLSEYILLCQSAC
jgi:hypothetical protein